MNKKLLFLVFIIALTSCSKDFSDEKTLENDVKPTSFSKEKQAISFQSMDVFKNFMETYQENEDELVNFYEEGFVPYRPLNNLNEKTFSDLVQAKAAIIEKENLPFLRLAKEAAEENDEEYDEEDDTFIRNDKFASILNAKGEIIIGDTIYRYTQYGRFSSHISKKEKLDAYIKQLTPSYQAIEGTIFVTEDIQRFIPLRDEFKKYQIVDMKNIENPSKISNNKKQGNESMTARFDIPINTDHYASCHNSRSSWVDRLFGVSYDCEYRFTKKRKLRTTFAVENYGVYMEVYAQAKFKQKTWFGWFSSRDAQYTYLKINHAALTFDEKEVSLSISNNDLKEVKKYGVQLAEWMKPKRNTQAVVNTITTPQSNRTFLSAMNDFGNSIRNGVNIAKNVIYDAELDVDFNGFFDKNTHNVVVLSIADREYSVTNKQIMESAFQELKRRGEILRDAPTGLFLMEHNTESGKVTSRSYTIYDEIHYSTGLAIVRKYFKIPKNLSIKNLTFGYVNNDLSKGKYNIQSSATFTYPKIRNIDLSIETGAFYNGSWGGSKLTVIYND